MITGIARQLRRSCLEGCTTALQSGRAPTCLRSASCGAGSLHVQRDVVEPWTRSLDRAPGQAFSTAVEQSPSAGSTQGFRTASPVLRPVDVRWYSTDAPKDSDIESKFSFDIPSDTSSSVEGEHQPPGSESHDARDLKTDILEAALAHVGSTGWTAESLRAGAAEQGLSPAVVSMFKRGEAELVEYYEECCNKALVQKLADNQEELQQMRVTERIRTAVRWRLEMVAPHIGSWPQAMSLMAPPEHAQHLLRLRAHLVDDIWYGVGDRATDTSWYTKRAILGAVYSSTECYMLTDCSPDFHDTWLFLDRRLEDVHAMGKTVAEASKTANTVALTVGTAMTAFFQEMSKRRYPH